MQYSLPVVFLPQVLIGELAAHLPPQLPPELVAALQSGQYLSLAALQSTPGLLSALIAAQQYGSIPGSAALQVPAGAPPAVAAGPPSQAPTSELSQALEGATQGQVYPTPQVQTVGPEQLAAGAVGLNQEQQVDSTQLPPRVEPQTTTDSAAASATGGERPVSGASAAATPSTAASDAAPAVPTHGSPPPSEPAVARHIRVKRTVGDCCMPPAAAAAAAEPLLIPAGSASDHLGGRIGH